MRSWPILPTELPAMPITMVSATGRKTSSLSWSMQARANQQDLAAGPLELAPTAAQMKRPASLSLRLQAFEREKPSWSSEGETSTQTIQCLVARKSSKRTLHKAAYRSPTQD